MRQQAKQLGDYLVYLVVRTFIGVLQALPISTCKSAARGFAYLMHDVLRIRRKVVDDNLRHAFPEWSDQRRSRTARDMWNHLFLMVVELAFIQRKIHWTNWRQHLNLKNDDVLIRAMLDDRPVLVLSGHYGNFEVGSYTHGLFDYATYAVARPLDNPYVDRYLNSFRGSNGARILPKQGSAETIATILENGHALAALGDQAAGPKGCWVDFFGRPASAHKAPAVFCLANEAPVLVVGVRRSGSEPLYFDISIHGWADPRDGEPHTQSVAGLTQWYTQQLEEIVREVPEQYWWVHRRWKGKRPQRRAKRAA
ncbi:MAG: lysophospholipid acyltransferase family protein [Pirellulales bacterium]|nr:lysophospholipid acyltransferase family protein [Pirellulales bacterium]